MSTREWSIQGYGFDVDKIPWELKKLNVLMAETEPDFFDEESIDSNTKISEYLSTNDDYKTLFKPMFDNYDWLDFDGASDDGYNYAIIYDGKFWNFPDDTPKSEEEAVRKMWEIINPYVKDSFTFEEFEKLCGDIDDSYYG